MLNFTKKPLSSGPVITMYLLTALWTACGPGDPEPKAPSSEAPAADTKTASPAPVPEPENMTFEGPGEKLSRTLAKNWTIATAPRYFNNDNLYDLINGGAEIFTEFGMQNMVTADYRAAAHPNQTITVEIYDMKTPLQAFGRMSRYLENRADPSTAGAGLPAALEPFGILGDGDLIAWKGQYLLHLTLMDENPDATAEAIGTLGRTLLPTMAEEIMGRIDGAAEQPPELAVLPAQDRIARSEMYHVNKLAGLSFLEAGVAARYRDADGRAWILFISSPFKTPGLAEQTLKAATLPEGPGRPKAIRAVNNKIAGVIQDGPKEIDEAFAGTLLSQLN